VTRYVAFATKGLEDVAARELVELMGLLPDEPRLGAKHILFSTDRELSADVDTLRGLATVDDVCLLLADSADVSTARDLSELLADLDPALSRLREIRPLGDTFSVTVTAARSPLGSSADIAAITAGVVGRQLGWQPLDGARAPVDVRVFLDGTTGLTGVRVLDRPLADRPYRLVHRKGALRPTVAAAMVRLACQDGQPHRVWDPFCGSGTILAEAYRAGHTVSGSDLDPAAVAAATENLLSLDPELVGRVEQADAASVGTWYRHNNVDTVVTNLPWGKQVSIQSAASLYGQVGVGVATLAARGGRACLLTTEPDRLAAAIRRAAPGLPVTRRRLGLLGQVPYLLTVGG
jgi:tRNA (guanine6-N2)-methyltransferase